MKEYRITTQEMVMIEKTYIVEAETFSEASEMRHDLPEDKLQVEEYEEETFNNYDTSRITVEELDENNNVTQSESYTENLWQ